MNHFSRGLAVATVFAVAHAALAQPVVLRRDTVLPVTFEDEISVKKSRKGDRFSARVDRNRDVPAGTYLDGRILDIRSARGKSPASVDLEFYSMVLPDGRRVELQAVPVSLDNRGLERDRDGRIVAKRTNSDQFVLGGVVGGFVLGSLIKKPFEGAFAGAIAGILMAESNKNKDEVTIKRGTRMGALMERDVRFDFAGRWDGWDDDRRTDDWSRDRDRRDDDVWNRDRDRRDDDVWNRDRDRRDDDDWDRGRDRDRYDERWDDRAIEIRHNERILRFGRDETPYRAGETVMVPLERTATQLGFEVTKVGGRTILVEDEETLLKIEQDSRDYRLNGRRGTLSRDVVIRDGIVFVPLEVLAEAKGEFITVNGTRVRFSA